MSRACDHASDIAAYALGALDPGEAEATESHLARCKRCRSQFAWLQPALETLPEAVEQIEPPPQLRESILATARADADEESRAAARAEPGPRLRIGRLALGPATGLVVLAVGMAAVVGYGVHDAGDEGTDEVAMSSRMSGVEASLEISGDSTTLAASGMPQLPGGWVYQVWVADGETVTRSTAFMPSADGSAATSVPEADGADAVMVSREPHRGEPEPTSRPVLTATL